MQRNFLFTTAVALILFISSCNQDFHRITDPTYYKWAQTQDSIQRTDTLTMISSNVNSLPGIYVFIVLPGYQGHTLSLNPDSSFRENRWSDVPINSKELVGKWQLKSDSMVTLKKGFKEINLLIHQYRWTTFLIPQNKSEQFAYTFNLNKHLIDSLAGTIHLLNNTNIDRYMKNFGTLCFIRRPK
ncbi:MAG: hypothetical protein ACXWW0_08230 [Bacteroidia bacterium]